ncbi:MAG: orotidine-5'-phosphate decarboxylase [Peptoniphilaceae bacterium]|nr:orotidine-5'-phosphate decarboxylase [Peptoniphilaceae bacterium]MDY6085792.1 orotidine-5'-phosphate decarboxylase [Peptoniphilaceae bacterium]
MNRRVILALDVKTGEEAFSLLAPFEAHKPFVKVGMELFYAEGPDIVRRLQDAGYPVFLDLKLHDIPHTVEQAMRRLSTLGVAMTNVHASGGKAMMQAAREGFGDGTLIAVTQLTSTSEEVMQKELLIERPLPDVVDAYAALAQEAGLDGVVCSPLESPRVHEKLGDSFLTVTPGIRFADGPTHDQKRVTTPAKARELQSSMIVIGRAVTAADDPVSAYERAVREFEEGV